MEHLLYACGNHSSKTWAFVGPKHTLALSYNTGEYIPFIILTSLDIVYNKPHPLSSFTVQIRIPKKW
jgi:hypothetical protein